MTCNLLKIDIPDEFWKCPKCGNTLYIEGDCPSGDQTCDDFHKNMEVNCNECSYGTSTTKLFAKYMKQKNLITCPHCKGKGVVKSHVE